MPVTFTESDFAPTNKLSFSEADFQEDFVPKKRTKEEVAASIGPSAESEVGAGTRAMEWVNDNLGMGVWTLSRMHKPISQATEVVHGTMQALGTKGKDELNPATQPTLDRRKVYDVIRNLTPFVAEEGGLVQGGQSFLADLISGSSSPATVAEIGSGGINKALPAFQFTPDMATDISPAMEALRTSQSDAERAQAALRLLLNTTGPGAMARGAFPKETAPSGVVPSEPIYNLEPRMVPYEKAMDVRQTGPVILGEQTREPRIKRIDMVPPEILELATQGTKPPVEPSGGEISFRGPAAAQGLPNARQLANEPLTPDIKTTTALDASTQALQGKEPNASEIRSNETGVPQEGVQVEGGPDIRGQDLQLKRGGEEASSGTQLPQKGKGVEIQERSMDRPPYMYSLPGQMFDPQLYKHIAKDVSGAVADVSRLYVEPLVERVGRIGGPVAKQVSEVAGEIVSEAKGKIGSLAPLADEAKRLSGKALRGGTTWIRGVEEVNNKAAISNFQGALEGTARVPPVAQKMVTALQKLNQAVEAMAPAGRVIPGKMQQMSTAYGLDVARRGRGPAWDAWTKGLAEANNVPLPQAEAMMRRYKAELDKPGFDVTAMEKFNKDFATMFPRAITHIRPGLAWHEVMISDAFNYAEQSVQRTAQAAAFSDVFKPGVKSRVRNALQAEIDTDKHGGEFDKLMRALQGYPVDSYTGGFTAPDTMVGASLRMASQVVAQPLRALVLTGNALANVGEAVSGGPAIFLGFKNVAKGMSDIKNLYPQLELNGQVNRAMLNNAFDPTSPIRSGARMFANGIRRGFAEQAMNELQEAQAAAGATMVANKIRAGTLSPKERQNVLATMRMMGINEKQALKALNLQDPKVIAEFERSAAARLTGGNQLMGDKSTLGANRAFNELFWFHSYPQMAWNQVRGVLGNLAEDVGKKDWPQVKANSRLAARMLGGRTLQGALYLGILAMAYEGPQGLKERAQEAKDDFGKFIVDSQVAAMGGPLTLVKKGLESGGDTTALQQTIGSQVTPFGIGMEIMDMSLGNGKYEGAPTFDRIGQFLEGKTPGFKAIKTGMALFGLTNQDRELMVAEKAFRRWRMSEKGWSRTIGTAGEEEDKQFRYQMRQAVKALENGQDWRSAFPVNEDGKVGKSLFARTLLKTPDGKPLSDEDIEKLRSRIGTKLVDKLQMRDAMVRQLARELGETEDIQKVNQPTGEFAIDAETQSKRGEHVYKGLSQPLQKMLKENGIDNVPFTPDLSIGKEKSMPVRIPEGMDMQKEFISQVETNLGYVVKSEGFKDLTKDQRKDQLQRVIQASRKIVWAKARSQVEESKQK